MGMFLAGKAFSGNELTCVSDCHSHHKERDKHTGLESEITVLGSSELSDLLNSTMEHHH